MEMLTNEIIGQRQIEVLSCFYREPDYQSICKALEKKYGGSMNNFCNPLA